MTDEDINSRPFSSWATLGCFGVLAVHAVLVIGVVAGLAWEEGGTYGRAAVLAATICAWLYLWRTSTPETRYRLEVFGWAFVTIAVAVRIFDLSLREMRAITFGVFLPWGIDRVLAWLRKAP